MWFHVCWCRYQLQGRQAPPAAFPGAPTCTPPYPSEEDECWSDAIQREFKMIHYRIDDILNGG